MLPVRVMIPTEAAPGFQYPKVPEVNYIDREVFAKLKRLNIVPSEMSGDAEFLRRYPLPGVSPGGVTQGGVTQGGVTQGGVTHDQVPSWVASAGTLSELAAAIGVDPDGLEPTVARWNKACAEGADPDFGRCATESCSWPKPRPGKLSWTSERALAC